MITVQDPTALIDPDLLSARLRTVLRGVTDDRVSVGVLVGDRIATAGSGLTVEMGCTIKLFTAAMMYEAIAHGRFDLDGRLDGLTRSGVARELMSKVTPRQLLEHAHGFDDSGIDPYQFRRNGYIDLDDLCGYLKSFAPLGTPGEHYNYSSCGALLAAGLLERVHQRPFLQLLTDYVTSIGVSIERRVTDPQMPACPATGVSIAITVADYLRFIAWQMEPRPGVPDLTDRERLDRETRALPGWHASERGIYLGWKYYGEGWFGHNSALPGHGLMVRLHPQERIAIVVASGDHPSAAITGALFRKHLPSLMRLEMPKLRTEVSVGAAEAARLQGTYANGAMSVRVVADEQSQLRAEVADSRTGETLLEPTRLHPAQDRIFFPQPAALRLFPFVQFVGEGLHHSRYLWTGSRILQRVEVRGSWKT